MVENLINRPIKPEIKLKIRRSIYDIQNDYLNGKQDELRNLVIAFIGIQKKKPDDPNSFEYIGGLHGQPYRDNGAKDLSYWGGYCNHGNILFPSWHRAYLYTLEKALQSIPSCENVTLPFWDETSDEALAQGVPWVFLTPVLTFDGVELPNPLYSYTLQNAIVDRLNGFDEDHEYNYSKEAGYSTVRYPYSGLVGTMTDLAQTKKHNEQYEPGVAAALLKQNVSNWLNLTSPMQGGGVRAAYFASLAAPNYTVFSNVQSAASYNEVLDNPRVVSLESPHNAIHLAVGGYTHPDGTKVRPVQTVSGANGDMGENDTAGFDPIFFFHHCFVDLVFWKWQELHFATETFDIDYRYPGTNTSDNVNHSGQGPAAGQADDQKLTMDSPLLPFLKDDKSNFTTKDVVNIADLGYAYGPSSLSSIPDIIIIPPRDFAAEKKMNRLKIAGINRAAIRGSFLIRVYEKLAGGIKQVGVLPVLSRWHVTSCKNCLTHLEVNGHFDVEDNEEEPGKRQFEAQLITRQGIIQRGDSDDVIRKFVDEEKFVCELMRK